MRYSALVEVRLKAGIADPQGATIEAALPALGFAGVSRVRVGKAIRLSVDAPDQPGATALVEGLCSRLLANPVIEDAEVWVALADVESEPARP